MSEPEDPAVHVDGWSSWRLFLLRILAIALVATAIVSWGRDARDAETSTSDESADAVAAEDPAAEAVEIPDVVLRLDRAWSPEPFTARLEGAAPADLEPVELSVDGEAVATVVIWTDESSDFVHDVSDLEPGPRTICLASECGRVLVAGAPAETREETDARIAVAIDQALDEFPLTTLFPFWTIKATGPNSGTGGYTVADRKIIFVSANPERTTDEFVVTVLHEMGHAVDAETMTDASREQFRELRSHNPSLPWGLVGATGDSRWLDSAEDFSEVFVSWVRDGDYTTASTAVAGQPTASDLVEFCSLLSLPGFSC